MDETVQFGRKRKSTQETDDLDSQPPNKRQKVNDAEMELDPLTKFLQTIRACIDINKTMAVRDRHPPTALAQSIRVQPAKSNVQATDRCPLIDLAQTITVLPEKSNVQITDRHPPTELAQTSRVQLENNVQATDRHPPTKSVRRVTMQNKKINVQATNRCPPIKVLQTTRVRH